MNKDVEKLILDSLIEVIGLKCINDSNNKTDSKLVYPTTRKGLRRVSEQESRFVFIKNIEKESNFLYSVEAPTDKKYFFTGKEENKRSGNFDVCLYDENKKKKHLFEFKALNPKNASYVKDFEKLLNDAEGLTNYFIQIVINTNSGTLPNIEKKYNDAILQAIEKARKNEIKNQSQLVIFLCDIGIKKSILKFEVISDKLISPIKLYSTDEILQS
jgi:asparagine N-glycosylation enzyme membrane subunit Stt3